MPDADEDPPKRYGPDISSSLAVVADAYRQGDRYTLCDRCIDDQQIYDGFALITAESTLDEEARRCLNQMGLEETDGMLSGNFFVGKQSVTLHAASEGDALKQLKEYMLHLVTGREPEVPISI